MTQQRKLVLFSAEIFIRFANTFVVPYFCIIENYQLRIKNCQLRIKNCQMSNDENKLLEYEVEYVMCGGGVNRKGFRTLVAGIDIDNFMLNPIALDMHDPDKRVIGRWRNLQKKGDRMTGILLYNKNNPRAVELYEDTKSGFSNTVSIGMVPIEFSTKTHEHPLLIKSELLECSPVNIPADGGAIRLYSNNHLELSGNITDIINLHLKETMDYVEFAKELGFELPAGSDRTAFKLIYDQQVKELNELRDKNKDVDKLDSKVTNEADLQTLKNEVDTIKLENHKNRCIALFEKHLLRGVTVVVV